MTDLTLEALRSELAPLGVQLANLDAKIALLDAKVSGLDTRAAGLDAKVFGLDAAVSGLDARAAGLEGQISGLDAKLAPMRAQLDGLPLICRSLTVLHQETRALRAAFNDFAGANVTAGEIEALHADVNTVQAENAELQLRLATVERLLAELRGARP
ncbi:hypothetical protein [Roseiarcus fermentans]|nr:hypothetical protein [Roseiarcus fermentans]